MMCELGSCNSPAWGLLRAVPSPWGDPATFGPSILESLESRGSWRREPITPTWMQGARMGA